MGDGGGGHWLVGMEWRPVGLSMCLLLLNFPCTIKSRSFLLAPAHLGGPRKRAVKRLWCVCVMVNVCASKELRERLGIDDTVLYSYYSKTGCDGMGMCCEKKALIG